MLELGLSQPALLRVLFTVPAGLLAVGAPFWLGLVTNAWPLGSFGDDVETA